MTAFPLGLLPLTVLWTLVCLGLGAWTMRAFGRLRPWRAATAKTPVAAPAKPTVDARLAEYDVAVAEVLQDGVVTQDEHVRLQHLRAEWGLSPADHVHAVARVQRSKAR